MSLSWEAQGLIETAFSLSLGGRKLKLWTAAFCPTDAGSRTVGLLRHPGMNRTPRKQPGSCGGGAGSWVSAVLRS